MARTDEAVLKESLRSYLNAIGAYWDNVAGGPFSKPGAPDIVACYRGRYIGIEAKTGTTVSTVQILRSKQIRRAGGIYAVVHDVDDLRDVIEEVDRTDVQDRE